MIGFPFLFKLNGAENLKVLFISRIFMADPHPNTSATISLNDFPDHLLLHIISFLHTLDAVRTTTISRRWRNLWTSIHCLSFDFDLFPPSNSPSFTSRRFADFVDRTLIRRPHSPLTEFRLQFDFSEYQYCSHIDSWIQYAINHKATELDIDFFIDRRYHNAEDARISYDFQFHFLKDSRVRVFRLCSADLVLPCNISSMKFLSITSIFLDGIFFPDVIASDLISACVNLESLWLEDCHGMNNFRICSPKLKDLVLKCLYTQNVEEGESFEICAPNLSSISICCFKNEKYSIKDSSSLVEACVSFPHKLEYHKYWSKVVRLFSGVKRLFVQNWWFKLLGQKDVSLERYALNNLNHLELPTGYTKYDLLGIAALLYIAPSLCTMILDYLPKIDEDENLSEDLLNQPINLSMPNLKQVKMKNYEGSENELQFLKLLTEQGVVLQKIVVIPTQVGEILFPPVVLTRRVQAGEILQGPPHFEVLVNRSENQYLL